MSGQNTVMHDLKPYPAYKDSGVPWLGEVPEHWQQLPGRACYHEKKVPNSGMQEQTVLSLSYGRIVVKPVEKLHGLVPASFETYQIVDPGNIIVRPTDLQNDKNSLRFGLSHHRGIITSAYMCLYTTELLERDYGYLLLHAYDLKKVFYGLGSGLRQNLNWYDFKYLPCVVPPPAEQAAIVRYLDYMDRRIRRYIRAKQNLITLLEEQKQSIIHQAVTGQIDVRTGQPYPAYTSSQTGWLGILPEQWKVARLGHISHVVRGQTPRPAGDPRFFEGNAMPWITVGEITKDANKFLESTRTKLTDEGVKRSIIFNAGTLVMTNSGATLGVPKILGINGCMNDGVAAILNIQEAVSKDFLYFFLKSSTRHLREITKIGGQPNLNTGIISGIELPVPTLIEQHSITGFLEKEMSKISSAISRLQNEVNLIREYHTRLIADVVTGKLDVRQAAAGLPEEMEEPELLDEEEDTDADDAMEGDLDEEMGEEAA